MVMHAMPLAQTEQPVGRAPAALLKTLQWTTPAVHARQLYTLAMQHACHTAFGSSRPQRTSNDIKNHIKVDVSIELGQRSGTVPVVHHVSPQLPTAAS